MDLIADTFDFNDHALRRLNEKLKDALDPRGVIAPGKSGIRPASRREQKHEPRPGGAPRWRLPEWQARSALRKPDRAGPAANGEQKANAGANAQQDRSSRSPDEALFVEKCATCHRRMGMGTVLLARRWTLARAAGSSQRPDGRLHQNGGTAGHGQHAARAARRTLRRTSERIAAYLARAKP